MENELENEPKKIRRASCAGSWYPESPIELTKLIATMFAEADKIPVEDNITGLIVPHAGYVYSGQTAAKAYKQLEGKHYDTVVVISPSHKLFFKGCSVFDGDGYETPLGIIETDKDLSEKIAEILPLVYLSNIGHGAGEARGEHALELQLPFLQIVLGKFKLVAIVMGDQEEDSVNALGEVLATSLQGTNSLLIASTDLSHFHTEKKANRLDKEVRDAVEKYDAELLMDKLERGKAEACGGGIIASVMKATKRLGSGRVEMIDYTTSGAATGDFEEVVGYMSAAIIAGKKTTLRDKSMMGAPSAKKDELILSDLDKIHLLKIAKDAIKAKFDGKTYSAPQAEKFDVKKGVFVTLKINDELRGCIGYIKSKLPLYDAIAEMAHAAAFDDPRFPELSAGEFDKLEFEISILSSLKRVHKISEIVIGRDGLLIREEMNSGLLLPQVATENEWDVLEFVENCCLKAGLPRNSYKSKIAELYRFQADVFV